MTKLSRDHPTHNVIVIIDPTAIIEIKGDELSVGTARRVAGLVGVWLAKRWVTLGDIDKDALRRGIVNQVNVLWRGHQHSVFNEWIKEILFEILSYWLICQNRTAGVLWNVSWIPSIAFQMPLLTSASAFVICAYCASFTNSLVKMERQPLLVWKDDNVDVDPLDYQGN